MYTSLRYTALRITLWFKLNSSFFTHHFNFTSSLVVFNTSIFCIAHVSFMDHSCIIYSSFIHAMFLGLSLVAFGGLQLKASSTVSTARPRSSPPSNFFKIVNSCKLLQILPRSSTPNSECQTHNDPPSLFHPLNHLFPWSNRSITNYWGYVIKDA